MPAEQAGPEHQDPLSALGRVDPPAAGVLESAREALWALVAAEMLAGGAPEHAAQQDARRRPKRASSRAAEQAVRRPPQAGP